MASASLLGGLALMGQTRGWLFAAPVVIVLYLVISRDRVRTAVALVAVLAAAAVYRVPVEAVHNAFAHPAGVDAALSHATSRLLWTSLVLGALTVAAAYADRRMHVPAALARRANAGLAVGIALAIGVGVVLLVASQGHPVRRVESAWNDFKRGPEPTGSEARFKFSLGSQRYDYWRVSWEQFRAHPLGGIGADNFQEIYLQKRHSDETPLYPHSIVFRTIAQTGIVGVLLLGGMLACALVAAWRATRRRRGLGAATAAGAVTGFLYWAAHGSVDWFWEFPALGVGAFAMLGLAASLLPRPAASRAAIEPISAGRPAWAAAGVAAVVIGLGLLSPWMAARAARDGRPLVADRPRGRLRRPRHRLEAQPDQPPAGADPGEHRPARRARGRGAEGLPGGPRPRPRGTLTPCSSSEPWRPRRGGARRRPPGSPACTRSTRATTLGRSCSAGCGPASRSRPRP